MSQLYAHGGDNLNGDISQCTGYFIRLIEVPLIPCDVFSNHNTPVPTRLCNDLIMLIVAVCYRNRSEELIARCLVQQAVMSYGEIDEKVRSKKIPEGKFSMLAWHTCHGLH